MKMFAPNGLLCHVDPEKVDELLTKGWTADQSDDSSASVSAREEARKVTPLPSVNRASTRKK